MKSWKVRLAGILTALIPVFNAVSAYLDVDPLTVPNWELALIGLSTGIGLLFTRQNNVSSEDAGIK